MAIERSELELVWPANLFAQEARTLLEAGHDSAETLGFLLAEAFHAERGLRLFQQVQAASPRRFLDDPWDTPAPSPDRQPVGAVELVASLADSASELPRYVRPLYYSARLNPHPEPPLTLSQVKTAFCTVIASLAWTGYFDDAFGSTCTDARQDTDAEGQRRLTELLDCDVALWPMRHQNGEPTNIERDWSDDTFYDVIEALHDLVARPRQRFFHSWAEEWDYQDFARAPGQAIYRWRVNELLARSEVPLRLAESGSDRGRLVRDPGDDRQELVQRTLQSPDPAAREDAGHAIALFRSRTATTADRRSAVIALAGILERRQRLLKRELFSKDEDALFLIANKFDLRHRDKSQQGDYNPLFLDWLFWWYLATVELTDRLLARQADTP